MHRHLIPALVLITLGTLFLMDNLGLPGIDVSHLISTWWPLLMILGGINLLLRRMRPTGAQCRD
ncbi:MAG: DUF5668 domain-containing protein [Pseudoxanthomonas sp.]